MAKAIPTVTETAETALSQTKIIIDGQRVSIGTNLVSAFQALREIPDVQPDARDRVYGFMSIYPGDIARIIQPEYAPEKSLAQVMGDLAIANIKVTSTLDWVFLATDIYPSLDPWPSWVPNIAIPYKDVTLSWVAGYQPQGKTKTAEVSWGPLDDSGVPSLRAKGFKLDVISDAGLNRNKHVDSLHSIAQGAVEINLLRYFLVEIMGAQVEHVLPEMELESFAWVQHSVASYFITKRERATSFKT
ncbi:hypothetical protein IQ07DRAFT_640448 [Pyrenochaeta sp. DS3sAY3a]|nr:hypothetical protein IQ07DRAFT_640448 [Pyrenochaeta sp. DS3sAY3a]